MHSYPKIPFHNLWEKINPFDNSLVLKPSEVHLWKIQIKENETYLNTLKKYLNKNEINNSEEFRQKIDQIRFIFSRAMLKRILSIYTNKPVNDLIFSYNKFNKPYIKNNLHIHFNISHSNDLIIFAFTISHQIGTDIENIKLIEEIDSISKLVFSEIEYYQWKNTPEENKIFSFYQLWTYKESIIKAIGTGFSYNTRNFTIEKTEKNTKIIFHEKEKFNIPDSWTIENIPIDNNYYAAFATPQNVSLIKYFEWNY